MTTANELKERARKKLAVMRRRAQSPRFSRVMGRFARDGLLVTNREYRVTDHALEVAEVLFAGELEPRLLELSQMLGEVGEGTLRSAHELLQVARQMIKRT